MRLLIINNLASGYHDGSIYDFIRCITSDGDESIIRSFSNFEDIYPLLDDCRDFDLVVASGGDSTVSTIAYSLKDSGIPILPFPAGTANMIAQNLMLPTENHAIAKLVSDNLTLDFDCGKVSSLNSTSSSLSKNSKRELPDSYGFSVMATVGFSNEVIERARSGKQHFAHLAYIYAALSVKNPNVYDFELVLDGNVVKTSGIGLMIMNFSKIGLDLSITHTNRPRDGKLDIVVLKAKKPIGYLPALTAATIDKAINFPDRSDAIEIHSAKEVEIRCNADLGVYCDEMKTEISTPFKAESLYRATKYVIDNEAIKFYSDN